MGNLNIDFKDKKNIYCIVMIAVILLGIYAGYTYMWDPFQKEFENLENQRILQIVDTYRLSGDDLKRKLAAIMPANAPKSVTGTVPVNNERNNENEKDL